GFRTSTFGTEATNVTGSKLSIGSKGRRSYSQGLMAMIATAPITRGWQSALAFAATPAPMLPPAPGRFSTTITPRSSLTFSASMRATLSSGPPAAYGTMNSTVRLGKSSAATAGEARNVQANVAAISDAPRRQNFRFNNIYL